MLQRLIPLFLVAVLPGLIFAIQFDPPLNNGIQFPDTPVNETSAVNFTVSEPNDVQPVIVRINQPEQDEFSVEPNEHELRGGGQVVFEVSFSPGESGEFDGRLNGFVLSANGNRMDFTTTLTGTGINEGDPVIEVRQQELSLELTEPGNQDEGTVDVGNGGEGDLDFEVGIDDECQWLAVDPDEGEIAGNSDQIIQLVFSTTEVIPDSGDHTTEVIISSNDPENEEVVVSVALYVAYQPAPIITVDRESIELNITELNQSVQEIFTISNGGERMLEFTLVVPELPWINATPLEGELEPGTEQEITVEGIHSGLPNGEYEVVIFINSNDPENDEIALNVRLVVNIDDNVPRMTLSTDTVTLEITEPDQQAIDTLIIGNSGSQQLGFRIQMPNHITWFMVSPDTGTIEPDAQVELYIMTQDSIPGNGEYSDAFLITSNDPENGEVIMEVRLIVDIQGISEGVVSPFPPDFHLSAPYPNPFNPETVISFALPEAVDVSLRVYDLSGRIAAILEDGLISAGYHSLIWNADDLPAGLYLIRIEAGEFRGVRKVMLIR
ncbi:MAG: T9SS type A sorting domain-containing protein [Candidatus Hatepunaea meridiana]|nr:T9SS type A sorting domain-containing protein [Candidatus Hatepunaea meridiana]